MNEYQRAPGTSSQAGDITSQTVSGTAVDQQGMVSDEHATVVGTTSTATTGIVMDAFQDSIYEVREIEEEVVIGKQARVVEEIVINKVVNQRTETLQDTVRQMNVDIEEGVGPTRTTRVTLVARVNSREAAGLGGTITPHLATTTSTSTMSDALGTSSTSSMGSTAMTGAGNEGVVESTLGNVGSVIEDRTGLDLDRSGGVGDRDRRDNY